jgi:WD40 repeat protein/tRNA A-37 threonylcarbamoyl transferase component Bud32
MTPPSPSGPSRQGPLEEVLEEYMQRLDRGEGVDREQLLARHPELADELRSYFAGSDELARLGRLTGPEHERGQAPAFPPAPALPETSWLGGARREQAGKARHVGDYELLEQIGQGGMGVIYKARQRKLQRLVALKMIRPDRLASPADVLRFRSEAEAAASLDHPNIVPIYEVGEHAGENYFSMKLIEGGSLAQHLPRLAADLPAGAELLAAVARAVHYAHQRGVLHRDLKPANILLDAQGRAHVTDFGLAKRLGPRAAGESLTQQGMIVGTPDYMAPEQAASTAGVSTAADVYSLGAILYELLTSRPPFRAETPLDTLVQLREREPVSPRSLNRRVDRDLETVCLKCLHKGPHQRYPSAEALAEDLERWRRGEPIEARPVSRRERALKWVRRRPALAALAALLVLVFLAGFAGVSWQWRRAAVFARTKQRTSYARAIALAYAEWQAGNAGRSEQVLGECDPELRGWEWHYLRRLFRARQLATLDGPAGGVLAVAFSPDGSRLAAAGADGVVKVWDRRALREALTLRGHTARVTAVAFSPDGRRLASGGGDGDIRVWDAASGEGVISWRGHAAGVTGLAFDPSGRRLASTGLGGVGSPGEVKLWGAATGEALAAGHWRTCLAAVAFSPDACRLATAGHDQTVAVWDAAMLVRVRALPVLGASTVGLIGSPLGQSPLLAVSALILGKTGVDTFEGRSAWRTPWTSVAYSADGGWVAAGSPEGLVRVWDAATAREHLSALTPTQAGVSGVAFSGQDGRILAAATADNTVRGWFTRSGKPAFTLRGHSRAVTAVACSPDGRCLASGSLDGAVKLWDISQRDDDLTLRPWASEGVTAVAFSPDGTRLASATRDKVVKVWAMATRKVVLTLRSLPGAVHGLTFGPDGSQFAAAGEDGTIRVWEFPAGRERLCLRGHGGPVRAVAFSPDGARLATAGDDRALRLWDTASGQQLLAIEGHGGPVHAVAFSPDGRRLASGSGDGIVRVWDAASGQQLLAIEGHGGPVHAVAFSRDGRQLATAGQDEAVRVWDAASGRLALALHGHAGAVRGVAYGPGGRLASAGDDMAVRLWDAAGQELLALRGHTAAVCALAFSPDGRRLASAGDDRTIKVWDGAPLEEVSAPTE